MTALAFELPAGREAQGPPEERGVGRDGVGLLVARRARGTIEHARFSELPRLLDPGDLLVVNTSATLPAAVPARRADGRSLELRFSTAVPDIDDREWRVVEPRVAAVAGPDPEAEAGETLSLPGGARAELVAPYLGSERLWLARLAGAGDLRAWLVRHGEPVRYGYLVGEWPLWAFQTVFAREPGSAEMPSAGRPFTPELVTRLIAAGVQMAPIVLHSGVSSPEHDEPPFPEPFRVPAPTASLVNGAREAGGRVIAVGTTVVRALETVAGQDGGVEAGEGWTDLVVGPERGPRAIDGLITGLHDPAASHLELVEAVAGAELAARAYEAALAGGYLWHEFGDSHLILP